MKNFNKFTVGALMMIGSLALTSCVDDEISSEVEAIYQGQAAYLAAQANLEQAQADVQSANAARQILLNELQAANNAVEIAEHEAELVDAQAALDKANADQAAALLVIASDIQDQKVDEADRYLGLYFTDQAAIRTLQDDIYDAEETLAELQDLKDADDIDQQKLIDLKNLEIIALNKTLADQEARLVLLNDVLANPASQGATVHALQAEKEALEDAKTVLDETITEKTNNDLNYGTDVTDFIAATVAVQAKESAIQAALTASDDAAETLVEKTTELTDLIAPATSITHAQAVADKATATAVATETQAIYNDVSDLVMEYTTLIGDIAAADATVKTNQVTIAENTANLTTLLNDFTATKAIFDANPSGETLLTVGPDFLAGIINDGNDETYYFVTALNPGASPTYGTTAYTNTNSIPSGTGAVTPDGGAPTVGEYFNVEFDDTTELNEDAFNDDQVAYLDALVSLSDDQADLDAALAKLAELQATQDEFDTDGIAEINTARLNRDNAADALTLATDILDASEAVLTAENAIITATQTLEEANQELTELQADVTRLDLLVDAAALAGYTALLDEIDALEEERDAIDDDIDALDNDIIFAKGLELILSDADYSGADLEASVTAINAAIETEEKGILDTKESIADANNSIEIYNQNLENLIAQLEKDIAQEEKDIEFFETRLAALETLAARNLELMNAALL